MTAWAEMREAAAHHAARPGEKLRAEGLVAGRMMVFLHTNPHNGGPWHSAQHGGRTEPTADTGALRPLSTGLARPWSTRHARLSPRYTTRPDKLMEAEAW